MAEQTTIQTMTEEFGSNKRFGHGTRNFVSGFLWTIRENIKFYSYIMKRIFDILRSYSEALTHIKFIVPHVK